MNYGAEKTIKTNVSARVEKVRLLLGLAMMFSGLYFGFFSAGVGESLGFLSVMASPFVMIADK
jgi:hypothetical protein